MPKRPAEDGAGIARGDERRSRCADVWLPKGPDNKQAALDFAVTSGISAGQVSKTLEDPSAVTNNYEVFKKDYQPPGLPRSTQELCDSNGLGFSPCVFEAHSGAFGNTTRKVLSYMAEQIALATGEKFEVGSLRLAQRLSATLHKENARAILERRCMDTGGS